MSPSEVETRNTAIAREFLAQWNQLSSSVLLPYFHADAVYQNMPWPALHGVEQIRGFLDAFFAISSGVEFGTGVLTARDNLVYTERVDQFWLKSGPHITLPLLGVFEFDADGKITAWRDYFDQKAWLDQGGPAL